MSDGDDESQTVVEFDEESVKAIETQLIHRTLGYDSFISEPPDGVAARIRLVSILLEIDEGIERASEETREQFYKAASEVNDGFESLPQETVEKIYREMLEVEMIRQNSNNIFSLATLVAEFVNQLVAELLTKEIISEGHRDSSQTQELFSKRIRKDVQEDLLFLSGVIDNGLKSEIAHLRNFRNGLVHDMDNRALFYTTNSIYSELNRGVKVLNKLNKMVYGSHLLPDYEPIDPDSILDEEETRPPDDLL